MGPLLADSKYARSSRTRMASISTCWQSRRCNIWTRWTRLRGTSSPVSMAGTCPNHGTTAFHSPYIQAFCALGQSGQGEDLRWILLPLVCPLPYLVRSIPLCRNGLTIACRHRPYLALFEQSVFKHICEIANQYPDAADKKKYLAAAQRFRIP